MTDHMGSSAANQHARRKSAKSSSRAGSVPLLPLGTGAAGFWRTVGGRGKLFRVNPNCCPMEAYGTLEVLLSYVRDRIDAAVAGDQPGDGSDSSISGDEAFVLGFVMHAALALAQSLPIEAHKVEGAEQ